MLKTRPTGSRKAKPALFATDLVRRILARQKWETRRPMRRQIPNHLIEEEPQRVWKTLVREMWGRFDDVPSFREVEGLHRCPFGAVGDILWVRETWAHDHESMDALRSEVEGMMAPLICHGPYYRADGVHEDTGLTWRPSIHMPKWLCRLVMPIVEVRVERLQDITEDGARAEGVTEVEECDRTRVPCEEIGCWGASRRGEFGWIWNRIYAKDAKMPHDASSTGLSWHDNPWVWVARWNPDEILIDEAAQQALVGLERSKGGR